MPPGQQHFIGKGHDYNEKDECGVNQLLAVVIPEWIGGDTVHNIGIGRQRYSDKFCRQHKKKQCEGTALHKKRKAVRPAISLKIPVQWYGG